MSALANCANCHTVFARNIRDICRACFEAEEDAFKTVYQFLSRRKNREATLPEIVKATDVEEKLIIKFIKEKRLLTSQFPKLAYPCDTCGVDIVSGRLCGGCSQAMVGELNALDDVKKRFEQAESTHSEQNNIYYTLKNDKK